MALAILLLIFIAALLLFVLLFPYYLFRKTVGRSLKVWKTDELPTYLIPYQKEFRAGLSYLTSLQRRELSITSHDGLHLTGYFLPNPRAKRVVLLAHGYQGDPWLNFADYGSFLYANGCSLLLFYQRTRSPSEGQYVTFGIREGKDAAAWAREAAKLPENKGLPLYLLGGSMGASTVLLAAREALPENTRGIIADCGFSSPWREVCHVAKSLHIPKFPFAYLLSFYCRLFAHFDLRGTDLAETLRSCPYPLLFVHGKKDTFVPPSEGVRNYLSAAPPKKIVLTEEAGHMLSFYREPARVGEALLLFFAAQENR